MKATYYYKDPVTKLILYKKIEGDTVEFLVFLEKSVLDDLQKKGIPVYSELKSYTRNGQIIDPSKTSYTIIKQGVNESKSLLIPFVKLKMKIGVDEVATEAFMGMFEYLKNSGYVATDPKSSYKGSRFKKKGFYQPEGEFVEVLSCENGITFFAENIRNQISFSLTISPDIEKISFGDFKEFKTKILMSQFSLQGKLLASIFRFTYVPTGQYFSMQTDIPYSDFERVRAEIENFAEKVCEFAKQYYPVKTLVSTTEKTQREIVQEQIDATNLALNYSSSMTAEQITDLKEYIESLELILKYI